MKTHTQGFKEEIKLLGKQQDVKITYILDNEQIELTSEDINSVTPYYEANLLKSVMKQFDFNSNKNIPAGTEINFKYGLLVNGEYEYLNYGNYIVYSSEKQENTGSYNIVCYDKMLYSMKDYESLGLTYPITLVTYLVNLCQKLGYTLATTEFANMNQQLPRDVFDGIGFTYRDVLDDIAEATGSTIYINLNDELVLGQITDTKDTIDEEYIKDTNVNFGEKYGPINSIVLCRSVSDNVYIQDKESIDTNGLCELKISDNQIMNQNNRSDYLQGIFDNIKGTEYYLNDFSSTGIMYYDLLDRYNVKIGEKTYSCVMLNDEQDITQGLEEQIHTERPETSETDYTKADKTDQKINQTNLIVDKQNQQIQALVTTNSELVQKTTQLEIDVDTIKGEISEVADLTITSDGYGSINVENINESEPILIRIYPGAEDIIPLRPKMGLYPRIGLYPHRRELIIMRTNDETPYSLEYNIPGDLYRLDNNYDEFVIDYENQKCYINRNIGINEAGEKYLLEIPTVENYEYPILQLLEGDYKIYMPAFENAYIYVRLMTKNIYTSHFATKIEMNSKIEETVDSIDLSVNQKLSNYSTTQEMNTSIDIKANEIEASVQQEISTITGENSIRNGTFENGLQNWNTFASQGDVQVTEYNNKKYAELITMNGETKLTQTIIGLIEEIDYKLSFKVFNKSFIPTGTTFTVKIWQTKNNSEELILLKSQEVELNGTEKDINIEFNMLYAGDVDIEFGLNISSFSSEEISAMVTDVVVAGGSISERFASLKLGLDGIESEVSKKVGDNEVISKINQSSEAVGINANRIELSANDILELLAGNTINISGRNIKISSNNFNVNENGIMTCNQAVLNNVTINSGNLNMQGNNSTPTITIKDNEGEVELYTNNFNMTYYYPGAGANVSQFLQKSGYLVECNGTSTSVEYFGITTPKLTQTSLAEEKKNFEKMKNCALDIIKMIDIYKYNLKSEKDTDKKHIGFVIGDNYKYSKEVTSTDNKGVDNYSFTSLCCKAIQEQQEQIEELKKEIEKLKGE